MIRKLKRAVRTAIDHIIFDFRFRFDEWDRSIDLLGKEVLPRLRKL